MKNKKQTKGLIKMAVIDITSENFEKLVLKNEKTVLLDFSAVWCGPCQMIAPVIHEIAEENGDVFVGKIDVDNETSLAIKFGVSSIPTLVVMKNGQAIDKAVGLRSKEQILEMLK
ncbi:MAG: thioredoxin [Clostridia bacterium]|nr:thioredoxin [Clostridia bacterium]MBO5432527.1 thioredoxin [Clostridia bacterium]